MNLLFPVSSPQAIQDQIPIIFLYNKTISSAEKCLCLELPWNPRCEQSVKRAKLDYTSGFALFYPPSLIGRLLCT